MDPDFARYGRNPCNYTTRLNHMIHIILHDILYPTVKSINQRAKMEVDAQEISP